MQRPNRAIFAKPLKSALHHWWPKSLSKFWAKADGKVTKLAWNGTEVRSSPSNFGAIKNAHHIKFSEDNPWNSTFEHVFGRADAEFPALADWLLKLEAKNARLKSRFTAQPLPCERRRQLAECLSSLIVRSPCTRNNIRVSVEYYRRRFGMEDYQADKTLIAGNMHSCHDAFTQAIDAGGKFVVLFSEVQEFIFGDGLLHNFPSNADHPSSPKCVIPLLPSASVIFVRPLSYRRHPELMTVRLKKDETVFFNDVVQIYSQDQVFYRNDKPRLIESFSKRQFLQYTYHQHEWLDQFIATAVQFTPESPLM